MSGDTRSPPELGADRLRAMRPEFGGALAALKMRIVAETTAQRPAIAERYALGRVLGTGASGTVFEARDTELERKVAVKLVEARSDAGARRVVREAQVLAQLSHPNVVQVFEVGMPVGGEQVPYVVMELVEGVTMRDWLDERARTTAEIVDAIVQAARGLHAAHRVGIVHRDFKPANVLIGRDGRVRVVDFGLARPDLDSVPAEMASLSASYSADRTATGEFVGTPAYMAPEAFRGESTAASDQYSLCVVLYEALVGRRPHECETLEELVELRREADVTVPRSRGIPRAVAKVIRRGLRRDPDSRYPDVAALLRALEGGRERRVALFASGAVVGLAATVALTRPETSECVTGQATWESLQDMSRVRDVLRDPLTKHIEGWVATEREACDAADGELESSVRECLTARVEEAQRLVEQGRKLDLLDHASVARALDTLQDPTECRDGNQEPLRAAPSERTAAVEVAQRKVERLRTLCDESKHEAAAALADELFVEAREIGFAPLLVEVASLAAHVALVTADYEDARAHNEECYFTAKDAALDWWAAGCASSLVMVTGDYLADGAQARVWAKRAEAGYERTGSDPMKELNYVQSVLRVARREGDYAEQERLARAGLAIVVALPRPEHRRTDMMLAYIGEAQAGQDEHEEAITTFTEVARLKALYYGEDSLGRADTLDQLGLSLSALGRREEARHALADSLRIREGALAPDDVRVAQSHELLAPLLAELGQGDEALRHARRALSLVEDHFGDDSAAAGDAQRILGDVLAAVGHRDEALEAYRRSLAIFSFDSPEHAEVVQQRIAELGG